VVGLGTGVVDRIDPVTNSVILTVETGGTVGGNITFGAGSVWTTYYGDLPLVQIDPLTSAVQRFSGYGLGDAITFGAGSLWLSGRVISRIVPPTTP
jgi:virginiamycin B lyase